MLWLAVTACLMSGLQVWPPIHSKDTVSGQATHQAAAGWSSPPDVRLAMVAASSPRGGPLPRAVSSRYLNEPDAWSWSSLGAGAAGNAKCGCRNHRALSAV